jgi:hypothetical protein
MLDLVKLCGVSTALLSAIFWGLGAGIRIPPVSRWRMGGQDPTTTALNRQSLMNAFAALFAAATAIVLKRAEEPRLSSPLGRRQRSRPEVAQVRQAAISSTSSRWQRRGDR